MCLPTPLKHTFCFVSAHLSVALLGHQPLKRLLCPLHPASAASITPATAGLLPGRHPKQARQQAAG